MKKVSLLAVVMLSGASFGLSLAASVEQLVLSAQPATKVESSPTGTERSTLSAPEAEKLSIVIMKRGDRYYWVSRANRELVHRTATGAYHYFLDPMGGGYIKVEDQSLLPEGMRDSGPRFRYLEHVGLGLGTITYWGSSESFTP